MLEKISMRNFRSYDQATFAFHKGVNVISGPNGIGKTNLLEALYLLSTGRSFRTKHLTDLIRYEASGFIIEASFVKEAVSQTLSFSFDGTQRRLLLNETPLTSQSELLGILPSVLYAPSDIALITGSPSERRRFLNIHIAQFDPTYVHHLLRYSRALKQRNTLLKQRVEDGIEVWEHEMMVSTLYLMKKRRETIEQLSPLVTSLTQELSAEQFEIAYLPSLGDGQTFESQRSRDLHLGTTGHGPHRDDLAITLDGKEAKLFSSEGQKRTCITALRLAQLDHYEQAPLFCIDDFGIHLDKERQEHLSKKLESLKQTIITTPVETFSEFLDLRDDSPFRGRLLMQGEGNLNKVVELE